MARDSVFRLLSITQMTVNAIGSRSPVQARQGPKRTSSNAKIMMRNAQAGGG
jgi:hypothetical protein